MTSQVQFFAYTHKAPCLELVEKIKQHQLDNRLQLEEEFLILESHINNMLFQGISPLTAFGRKRIILPVLIF